MKKSDIYTQDTITKAWFFASNAHANQKLPASKLPYLTHIGNVMMEIMRVSNTLTDPEFAIICAILHDTIEDTEITYQDLHHHFSYEVAKRVLALTKDNQLGSKEQQMLDSLDRIKNQPFEIWAVKMADRIANLRQPPSHWQREKIMRYQQEAELILTALGEANTQLAGRLQAKILDYQQYYEESKR